MANPVTQAVLLMQRLFWYPLIEDPQQACTDEFPPDMWERGLITLVLCLRAPVARAEVLLPRRGQVPGAALT